MALHLNPAAAAQALAAALLQPPVMLLNYSSVGSSTTLVPAAASLQLNTLEGITGLPNVSHNGLGIVPQMGWNTWNSFGCSISESTITSAAEKLVSSGLRDLGYTYVLIDDCWHASSRAADGKPQYDSDKFPSGLKNLTDHLHSLGFKASFEDLPLAGIYSSAGEYTCGLQFGSLGYEELDAQQYADWGFDYLKYDNCYSMGQFGNAQISYSRYKKMSDALIATGREIFYSLCSWGDDQVWMWASSIANSYRMSGDIDDTFDEVKIQCPPTADTVLPAGFGCSVANILGKAAPILQKSVRGGWPDLDMLEVGRGGMTVDQQIVHFSLWALIKSPLILGNDLTTMDNMTLAILSNKALIDFHQGTIGGSGVLLHMSGGMGEVQVWRAAVGDGSFAVAVVNFTPEDATIDVDFKTIFRDDGVSVQNTTFSTTDFWAVDSFPLADSIAGSFGSQPLDDKVSGALKGLQVRAKAGRFWKFTPADAAERKRALEGRYLMTKE